MRVHLLSAVAMLAVAVAGASIRPAAAAPDGKTNPNRMKTATRIKSGENPNPIHLVRPPVKPLSAMAELGREIFFDTRLSPTVRRMKDRSCLAAPR
jgi:cytochrome c peroxidase